MKKTCELVYLTFENGCYKASIHDLQRNCYGWKTFIFYNKKEVISLLRNKYNCSVSHEFY